MTAQELIAFETDIAQCFNDKKIFSPIHLYSGGEEALIEIFKDIREQDWILCSWRSHYQCLLKGVTPENLKAAILDNRSISLCFPEHRILSSAIVGGVLPIAAGLGMAIKRSGEDANVHCFMGDMTRETGIAEESIKYCRNFNLPVYFHIEDNGLSTCTETKLAWGLDNRETYFSYKPGRYPHSGSGIRIQF